MNNNKHYDIKHYKGYEVISLTPDMSQYGLKDTPTKFSKYIIKYLIPLKENNPYYNPEILEDEILVCNNCFSYDVNTTNSSKGHIIECNNCYKKEVLKNE